ncbi:MAG: DUF3098 domain-containing protein [Bacteroidales bacterium]|nr:DUF3098 domain-containing protein [Candidatus Cacconaster merdequi]
MDNFSLPSRNVKFLLAGLLVMVLGFVLMLGGGSDDPSVFNPAMFNARRLVVSPLLITAGVVTIIVSIMKVPKEGDK